MPRRNCGGVFTWYNHDMKRSDTRRVRQPFAKYITMGVIILAVAAVIIAWMDETGVDGEFIRIFVNAHH